MMENKKLIIILIIIIIIFLFLKNKNENFLIYPVEKPYKYCKYCGDKDRYNCGSCVNCGYCVTENGYGICTSGDEKGPYFRNDCLIWRYREPGVALINDYSYNYPYRYPFVKDKRWTNSGYKSNTMKDF